MLPKVTKMASMEGRPLVIAPQNIETEPSCISHIIAVIGEQVSVIVNEGSRMARTVDVAVADKKLGAATQSGPQSL